MAEISKKGHLLKRFVNVFFIPIIFLFSLFLINFHNDLPDALSVDAPPTLFSAGRAYEHLKVIAEKPRPMGTKAHSFARNYIVGQLQSWGLDPRIIQGRVHQKQKWGGGFQQLSVVNNVLAYRKGRNSQLPAILMMAHYDTVQNSVGAGDDGAGVVSMLEVARIISQSPQSERDIIFLFTDGEEQGLLGARSFFGQKANWEKIGLIVNLEARGSSGPAFMFQTSVNNQRLIELIDPVLDRPVANSLMAAIYRVMHNDTDLTVPLQMGIPALNFAFIDGYFEYHRITDTLENLSLESLQHMGSQALAVVQAAANSTDDFTANSDSVYFDILSRFFVVMSPLTQIILFIVSAGLVVGLIATQGDRFGKTANVFASLKGTLAFVIMGVFTALLLQSLFQLMVNSGAVRTVTYSVMVAHAGWIFYGLAAVALGLLAFMVQFLTEKRVILSGLALPGVVGFILLLVGLTAPFYLGLWGGASVLWVWLSTQSISKQAQWSGGLLLLVVASGAMLAFLPGGAYLIIIPVIFASLLALVMHRKGGADTLSGRTFIAAGALLLPGMVFFTWLAGQLFNAMSVPNGQYLLLAVPMVMIVIIAAPLLIPFARAGAANLVMGAGLIGLWAVTAFAQPSDRYPQPDDLFLFMDTDTGQLHYASAMTHPGVWSAEHVTDSESRAALPRFLVGRRQEVTLSEQVDDGKVAPDNFDIAWQDEDHKALKLIPRQAGDMLALEITGARALGPIQIDGWQAEVMDASKTMTMVFHATPVDGVLVEFKIPQPKITARLINVAYEPEESVSDLLPAAPSGIAPVRHGLSNSLVLVKTVKTGG